MPKLSMEESLKLLLPAVEESNYNNNTKKKVKKNTRSPVKIPTVIPVKNKLQDDIEEEKKDSKNLYTEEKKEEKTFKSPHTPTRFKIETPTRPKRNFNQLPDKSSDLNLYERLKDKRYTLLKYIIDEENILIFVVCYDPNGQIIFVKIEDNVKISIEEKNIIRVKNNYGEIILDAFQNSIQEKMTLEIQGVAFFNGSNYLFSIYEKNGNINNLKYDIIDCESNKKLIICETYTIVSLKEIEKQSTAVLESTKKNYRLIQQQQQLISTNTLDNIVISVNNLSNNLRTFNKLYKNYNNNIIDDWGFLGSCSCVFYENYGKGKLTESEKEKFDKVSVNMYARFKAFNDQLMLINQLNDVIPDIDKSCQLINKISEEIENSDTKMSGNIINIEDLDIDISSTK